MSGRVLQGKVKFRKPLSVSGTVAYAALPYPQPARDIPVLTSAVARPRPERPFGSNVLPFAMLGNEEVLDLSNQVVAHITDVAKRSMRDRFRCNRDQPVVAKGFAVLRLLRLNDAD
jgi:hypothetical protein